MTRRLLPILLFLLLPFLAPAQEAGPRYVHMLYDTELGVMYPAAAQSQVTNNPVLQALSSGVSNLSSDVSSLYSLSESNSAAISSNAASVLSLSEAVLSGFDVQSNRIESVRSLSESNSASVLLLSDEVERLSGLQVTNAMIAARAMVMVYDLGFAVDSNKVLIVRNAEDILGHSEALQAMDRRIDELSEMIWGVQPAIETPDGQKWKAVGLYLDEGVPTFAWSKYTGDHFGTIVLDMPDDRHFKMVGTYQEGKVTHAWEEIEDE